MEIVCRQYHVNRPFRKFVIGTGIIVCILGVFFSLDFIFEIHVLELIMDKPVQLFGESARPLIGVVVLITFYYAPFVVFVVLISNEKLKALTSYLLCSLVYAFTALVPYASAPVFEEGMPSDLDLALFLMVFILPPILFSAVIIFNPISVLAKRLSFMLVGLTCLIALNGIAKLDLHPWLQAPK
jgi:hypothetical protein